MVEYFHTMIFPALVVLIAINAMFLFTTTLPATQDGSTSMTLGLTSNDISTLKSNTSMFYNDTNNLTGPGSTSQANTSTSQPGFITILQSWLFGGLNALGLLGLMLKYLGLLFFGYTIWINYFFNPLWWPGLQYIGWAISFFFFIVEMYGIYTIVSAIFGLGTGSRSGGI